MRSQDFHLDDGEPGMVPGLQALARERLPERDLWAGIESRIKPPAAAAQQGARRWPLALAASVCLALLTGVLLREQPLPPADTAPLETASRDAEAANGFVASHGKRPYGNRDGQSQDVETRGPRSLRLLRSESLDNAPALVAQRAEASGLMKTTYTAGGRNADGGEAILRANLKLVSQAERELRRALRVEPDSASLQRLLAVTQAERSALTTLLVHARE